MNTGSKWLWYLDETNPSTARDGVGDAFKLQHNLCPHTDIAQRILVSGGLRIIKAFEHNCNPWLTRAPGAPHTYNYAINMGLDPHSNWQPETFDLDAEEISFVLAAGDAPCLFTFGGVDGDPRTQQWALQTNETRTVSIMAWVDCENRISAGKSGGTVQLSGTHYSMGFSTENAPGGAPSPMKSGGSPGFEPMMTRAGGKLTCFECWLKNGGTIWPSYAYNFKRCWPPPPDARGFSVGFEDKVWCLDSPPPVLLWHTNHFLYAISSEQSRAYVPCDCTVDTWTHTEATNEPGYACQYVAHAGTTCGCVSCGGATCLVLQKPKIKITSCTKNVSPDFTTPPQGVNNTLTVSFEIENYTPEMAKHFYLTVNASRRKKDGTDETGEALPFANGQLTHTLNMANFSITWDGILTNSGYTLVEGTNTFAGFNTINEPKTLNRQLCAASIGETMPLPEFDVVVTAWHKCPRTFDVAVKASEARENVKVPQILLLRCRPNFLEKYCEHVFSEIHVGTIAVYKTPNEMPTSEYEYVEKVREYIQGQLPPNANIIVVNGHDPYIQLREGIGNVKTIWLEYELTPAVNLPAAAMGYALPTNANEGNGLRSGECFVSLQRIENYLVADYDQRRTYDSLASSNERTHIDPQIKLVAMHEPLHLMGLVSKKYLKGGVINEAVYNPISHNLDNPKDTTYIMNRLYNPLTLNAKLDAYELKPMNKEYLEFTCPKPQP